MARCARVILLYFKHFINGSEVFLLTVYIGQMCEAGCFCLSTLFNLTLFFEKEISISTKQ